MGCCPSKHDLDDIQQEAAIAEAEAAAHQYYMSERPNPPIVITKEYFSSSPSPASHNGSRLPTPISSANPAQESEPVLMAFADDPRFQQIGQGQLSVGSSNRTTFRNEDKREERQQQLENHSSRAPVVIEERTQEHNFGEPPDVINKTATIKPVKPIVLMQPKYAAEPAIIPAAEIPEARDAAIRAGVLPPPPPAAQPLNEHTATGSPTSDHHSSLASNTPSMKTANTSSPTEQQTQEAQEEDKWTISIRRSTSKTDDLTLDIPSIESKFITVADLKKEAKEKLKIYTDVKLIHMGRILQDYQVLIPANLNLTNEHYVKISKHGVVQLMMIKERP